MEVVEYCWTRSPKNTPTSWEVKEGYFDAWSTPTANREDTLLSQWGRDQMWWCSWTHGLVTEILWWPPPDHKTKTIGIHFELHLSEFILGWIEEKMIEGRNRKENGKSIYWEIHFSKDQHVEESFHPRWNFKRIGLERFPKTWICLVQRAFRHNTLLTFLPIHSTEEWSTVYFPLHILSDPGLRQLLSFVCPTLSLQFDMHSPCVKALIEDHWKHKYKKIHWSPWSVLPIATSKELKKIDQTWFSFHKSILTPLNSFKDTALAENHSSDRLETCYKVVTRTILPIHFYFCINLSSKLNPSGMSFIFQGRHRKCSWPQLWLPQLGC